MTADSAPIILGFFQRRVLTDVRRQTAVNGNPAEPKSRLGDVALGGLFLVALSSVSFGGTSRFPVGLGAGTLLRDAPVRSWRFAFRGSVGTFRCVGPRLPGRRLQIAVIGDYALMYWVDEADGHMEFWTFTRRTDDARIHSTYGQKHWFPGDEGLSAVRLLGNGKWARHGSAESAGWESIGTRSRG